jgi:DNA-binding MarR family transcriptional regulator
MASRYLDVENLCRLDFPGMERDEVDDLVEAWTRERSDLDLAPVEVFSRISRLARLLDKARREAFTAHRVEPWEFDVLAALRRAGKPYQLTPGALLRETLVTSGTMTNRVDRLVERGLVERQPDPRDRRGVLVRLSATGKKTVDGAFETLLASERELLADLTEDERRDLAGMLRRLMRPLREPGR